MCVCVCVCVCVCERENTLILHRVDEEHIWDEILDVMGAENKSRQISLYTCIGNVHLYVCIYLMYLLFWLEVI